MAPLCDAHRDFEVELETDPDVVRYPGNGHARTPGGRRVPSPSGRRRHLLLGLLGGLCRWGFCRLVGTGITDTCQPLGDPAASRARLSAVASLLAQRPCQRRRRELLRHGFADLGLCRIFGQTMTVNVASRATMAAVGLEFVRTFFMDWVEPNPGADQGEVEYAITRWRWQASGPTVGDRTAPRQSRGLPTRRCCDRVSRAARRLPDRPDRAALPQRPAWSARSYCRTPRRAD